MDNGKDYIIQVKVRNGPLLRAMRRAGCYTAADLTRATGVGQGIVGGYLGLKTIPLMGTGTWRPTVITLATFFRCLPEDLFPKQHIEEALKKSSGEFGASLDEVKEYLIAEAHEDTPEQRLIASQAVESLSAAISTLSPREQRMVILRFGLQGNDEHTLGELAAMENVSTERARQILAKGMRRLRDKSRAADVTDALESFGMKYEIGTTIERTT